jgi:hypothetical protein
METMNTQTPARPDNNLVKAIISILLCWPFGIPAIINSQKVNSLYDSGNYAAAEEASKKASKWSKIGIIVGAIGIALNVFISIVATFIVLLSEL